MCTPNARRACQKHPSLVKRTLVDFTKSSGRDFIRTLIEVDLDLITTQLDHTSKRKALMWIFWSPNRFQVECSPGEESIAASIFDEYSVSPSTRPVFTRCCFTLANIIQVCSNFHEARAFITNTRPDEIGARTSRKACTAFSARSDETCLFRPSEEVATSQL